MPTEREINTLCELSQADFKLYLTDRARGLVRVLLEEVMQAELTALLQAQPYERNAKRRGQRNGSYDRDLTTSLGRLEGVQVPRDRAGQFQTRVFEQYQRRQGEVDQAIQTMFIKGLSTTAVGQVVGPLLDDAPSPRRSRGFFIVWTKNVQTGGSGHWTRIIATSIWTALTS